MGFVGFLRLRVLIIMTLASALQGCFVPKEIKRNNQVAEGLMASEQVTQLEFAMDEMLLRYVSTGKTDSDLVMIFIHGTPGDWHVFGEQLGDQALRDEAWLVAIDRPGWGASPLFSGGIDTSLMQQSDWIAPFLKTFKEQNKTVVLVGHSLGATLAPLIAMNYPDLVDGSVVIAGDLTEQYYRKAWYNDLADLRLIRAILPKVMVWANDEVMALKDNLAEMDKLWSSMETPMWVIQGGKDGLVDPRNAEFAEGLGDSMDVTVNFFPEANHLIHLNRPEDVRKILLDVIRTTRAAASGLSSR